MNGISSVLDILRNAKGYFFSSWDSYLSQNLFDYYIIIPYDVVPIRSNELFTVYHVHEIFELGNCFLGHNNELFMLWHICKSIPSKCKISIFRGHAHPYLDDEMFQDYILTTPELYSQDFKNYISMIDSWLDTNLMPEEDKGPYEFVQIPYQEFELSKPVAFYYSKRNEKIRKRLINDTTVPLKDVASIIQCHILDADQKPRTIRAINGNKFPNYPFSPERDSIEFLATNHILHKGDIICNRGREGLLFFLVDKEPTFDLYAPPATTVIQAHGVSPEYLYLYLSSNTAKQIVRATTIRTSNYTVSTLTNGIQNFPVIIPKEDETVYQEEFARIASPDSRYYISVSTEIKQSKTMEDEVVKEYISKLNNNNFSLLKQQIEEDIREMDICLEGGAYKATLILAGSILEALLIDWISEIKCHDYFEDQLMKRIYDKKRRCYKTDENGNFIYSTKMRADLSDYIDEIKDLKKPEWMKQAEESDMIREKRNLVHAKLCLKKNEQISETLCRKVRGYLLDVIESRLKQ